MTLWQVYGPDKEWLTLLDVMELLGVKDSKVYEMVREGDWPAPTIKAGPQSPPKWHALVIACWLYVRPHMVRGHEMEPQADEPGKKKEK